MSQPTQSLPLRRQLSAHRVVAISALLALLATAAVLLVLAIDGGSSHTGSPVAHRFQPAARSDGGPEESAVAASVGSPTSAGPDENRTAVAIGKFVLRP